MLFSNGEERVSRATRVLSNKELKTTRTTPSQELFHSMKHGDQIEHTPTKLPTEMPMMTKKLKTKTIPETQSLTMMVLSTNSSKTKDLSNNGTEKELNNSERLLRLKTTRTTPNQELFHSMKLGDQKLHTPTKSPMEMAMTTKKLKMKTIPETQSLMMMVLSTNSSKMEALSNNGTEKVLNNSEHLLRTKRKKLVRTTLSQELFHSTKHGAQRSNTQINLPTDQEKMIRKSKMKTIPET